MNNYLRKSISKIAQQRTYQKEHSRLRSFPADLVQATFSNEELITRDKRLTLKHIKKVYFTSRLTFNLEGRQIDIDYPFMKILDSLNFKLQKTNYLVMEIVRMQIAGSVLRRTSPLVL